MSQVLDIIQLVVEVILLLLGLYLAFFKSYITEKGKNLATKEDIAGITRQVEGVKNELQLTNRVRQILYDELKLSAIQAYETLQLWHRAMKPLVRFIEKGELTEAQYMKAIEDDIAPLKEHYVSALSRLELYVGEGRLLDLFKVTEDEIIKLWAEWDDFLFSFMYMLELIEPLREEEMDLFNRNLFDDKTKISEEINVIVTSYEGGFGENREKIKGFESEFTAQNSELRKELNKLIRDPNYLPMG